MTSMSATAQLDLGLRWLNACEADEPPVSSGSSWKGFLTDARGLPPVQRLALARLWPLWGPVSGVATLSGLMVWPDSSGIHILLFLVAFWLVPLAVLLWTGFGGVLLGRAPWWRLLITHHGDRVINLWFVRQSLTAQLLFAGAGLASMWLILITRQVIFYWGTSIPAVAGRVGDLFELLGLGVIAPPSLTAVASAEAGAVTGWEASLLCESYGWALWLTQVTGLWVVAPLAALLIVVRWRLALLLPRWPDHNHRLRLWYERWVEPALGYRALQPEQPVVASGPRTFPVRDGPVSEPGFFWQEQIASDVPGGSVCLGTGAFDQDANRVREYGSRLAHWYFPESTVPTGEIADLIQLHGEQGARPRLHVLVAGVGGSDGTLRDLHQSWGVFLERNGLDVALDFIRRPLRGKE